MFTHKEKKDYLCGMKKVMDLYSDYLSGSSGQVTANGMSAMIRLPVIPALVKTTCSADAGITVRAVMRKASTY